MAAENDLRLDILNTLLTTPHRELGAIHPVHRELQALDPRFYVRLAAWYFAHGDVRDHKEMFVITLALAEDADDRDVGLAMLRKLPPYEVGRVVDFIHGRKTRRKKAALVRGRRARAAAVSVTATVEDFGLFRNVPRGLKTEVARYLREREADADWFDGTVLQARKSLKRLYAILHIKPGERAQRILFDDNPPEDSRAFALRQLAKATDPAEQARAIIEHRIPYRVAAALVRAFTPTVLFALIERMSPQEVINNLASLHKRGAGDNPDLQALIDEKLAAAETAGRVSALKTGEAAKAAPLPEAVRERLEKIADAQVKAKGRIERPTAILVDKSGSMEAAIELGKRIGALLSTVCASDLFVYAFNDIAYPIERGGDDMASWERVFKGIRAQGGTSCGIAVEALLRKRQVVEQIILITDEEENTLPHFVPTLQQYRAELKADPAVCIVRTQGGSSHLERQCQAAGIVTDVFQFTGDYYSLPNLIPILSRPSKRELLQEILEYPLPRRAG